MDAAAECLNAVKRQRDLNSCKDNFFERFGDGGLYAKIENLTVCKAELEAVRSEISRLKSAQSQLSDQDLLEARNQSFIFHRILEATDRNIINRPNLPAG